MYYFGKLDSETNCSTTIERVPDRIKALRKKNTNLLNEINEVEEEYKPDTKDTKKLRRAVYISSKHKLYYFII